MPRSDSPKRRRARRLYAGLLAMPLMVAQCQPACEPVPPAPPAAPRVVEQRDLGTTWEGRPITAFRVGTPGGKVVLAIGSIHGDEQAGIEIVEHVRDAAAIPGDLDVWVIPSINPDGNVRNIEGNAHGVDLNRNWPPDWAAIDCQQVPQNCSGPYALSEPETQVVANFITEIQPRVTIWYHAVGPVVDRATQHGVSNQAVLDRYAAAVGYPVYEVSCGTGGCTGNATQFGNATIPGSSAFVVELGTKIAGGMGAQGVLNHVKGIWAAAAAA
jgi:protein MpaA